jgi:hypothetical protein
MRAKVCGLPFFLTTTLNLGIIACCCPTLEGC